MHFYDSIHDTNQTVVLIFQYHRNWFFPRESVVDVVGSLSYRSNSISLVFQVSRLFPLASLVSATTWCELGFTNVKQCPLDS